MEDTPHYNKFNNVNIDLRHQDQDWLEQWRKFTGDDQDEMDDKDPWAVTGIDSKIPTPEIADQYLGASILLSRGSTSVRGRVKLRKRDSDGNLFGALNPNPIKDTRTYEVEFPGGEIAELTVNAIAEAMYSQCDDDGNKYLLFDCIVEHKMNDKALTSKTQPLRYNGRDCTRQNTVGWHLCVQWFDSSTSSQILKDLKETYPLQVAEYAVAQGIEKEPTFNWWVPFVLKKRKQIIKSLKG